MTKGDNRWHHLAQEKKCVIYRLDIISSITDVAQLMVSKFNFFCRRDNCRYPERDIRRGIANFIPCQEVEKWQWLIVSIFLSRCLEKLQFILTETRQISNLRNQDTSKEILSNLVRKDFAKFSDKFTHFQYATLEIFKWVLNNYSVWKLRFFNQQPMYVKMSPISIMQLTRIPNHIFYRKIALKQG